MQIACEFRLIKTSGAWYTISCAVENISDPIISNLLSINNISNNIEDIEKFFKFQGSNGVTEFLTNNPELCDFIYNKIKEIL